MVSRIPRVIFVLGTVVVLVAVACGSSDEQPAADDLVCPDDTRVIFHGDYGPDFVGHDTPEEAIAEAAVQYGTPTRADDAGNLWLIHDDQGQPVGKIAVVAAPAGGFIAGDHTLCGNLEP